MIGIVDYEAGNITSVVNACTALDIDHLVSADRQVLSSCSGIILPGVGAAPGAMASLAQRNLTGFLGTCTVPLLGICLGMQILYQLSDEGNTPCLGLVPGRVKKINAPKVPHMGWNRVEFLRENPLSRGIGQKSFFYFAHSYILEIDGSTIGTTDYGGSFSAAMMTGNIFGVQFHPEKSGDAGLRLLKNFDELCKSFPR